MNGSNLLSASVELLESIIESEFIPEPVPSSKSQFMQLINRLYTVYKIHTILTPGALEKITTDVFSNKIITDSLLSITDRFMVMLRDVELENADGVTTYQYLVRILVDGLTHHKKIHDNGIESSSLIPKYINDAIYIDDKVIASVIHDNPWLMVLLILAIFKPFADNALTLQETHTS